MSQNVTIGLYGIILWDTYSSNTHGLKHYQDLGYSGGGTGKTGGPLIYCNLDIHISDCFLSLLSVLSIIPYFYVTPLGRQSDIIILG